MNPYVEAVHVFGESVFLEALRQYLAETFAKFALRLNFVPANFTSHVVLPIFEILRRMVQGIPSFVYA